MHLCNVSDPQLTILHFYFPPLPWIRARISQKITSKQGAGHPIIAYTQRFRPSTTDFTFLTPFSPTSSKLEFREKMQLARAEASNHC